MDKYFKKEKFSLGGFTLVEMLTVLAIMGIMASVGLVSYQNSKRDAALRAAQREVATVIRLAQSYATQGKTQGSGVNEKTPCGYGFKFTDQKNYQIYYVIPASGSCSDSINPSNTTPTLLNSYSLDNDVSTTNSNLASTTQIYFRVPFGATKKSDGSAFGGATIILSHPTNTSDTVSVEIDPSGRVTE